jgi:hypothetical protein
MTIFWVPGGGVGPGIPEPPLFPVKGRNIFSHESLLSAVWLRVVWVWASVVRQPDGSQHHPCDNSRNRSEFGYRDR